jgi:hypothetical protein
MTELILAILIFALSMGICGSIFTRAFEATTGSTNLNKAVFLAENAAEAFHSLDDSELLAESLTGHLSGYEEITVFYDGKWNATADLSKVAFTLMINIEDEGYLSQADIVVSGINNDIYRLSASKLTF